MKEKLHEKQTKTDMRSTSRIEMCDRWWSSRWYKMECHMDGMVGMASDESNLRSAAQFRGKSQQLSPF